MANPNASIQISFSEDDSSSGDNISLSLDTDKNTELYGEERTTFPGSRSVYLAAIMSPLSAYVRDVDSSDGTVHVLATKLPLDVEETITFTNTKEATLSRAPQGAVSYKWIGSHNHSVRFDGQSVVLRREAIGFLKCTYKTLFTRLRAEVQISAFGGEDTLSVIVLASTNGGAAASITINYSLEEDGAAEYKTYIVNATSLCASGVIAGAVVTQDGAAIGTTDGSGNITFESWTGTYTFAATANGYTTVSREVTLT